MKFIFLIISVVSISNTLAAPYLETVGEHFSLPEGVKTCYQGDSDLNQCIKNAIQEQLPLLEKGSQTLGIPPLDPFVLHNERFQYSSGAFQGVIILKTLKIFGISKAVIKDVNVKITDNEIIAESKVFFHKLFIEGEFKADIKINEIKMRPKGVFNVSISDVDVTGRNYGVIETKNDEKHLKFTKIDIDPNVGDLKFHATGLLPDSTLNSIIVDIVNQNWPSLYKITIQDTKYLWEPLMLRFQNQFLEKVPLEKLLTKTM